jgi:tRNA-2-methylthio-N6-dimethylallyladenosine synthase
LAQIPELIAESRKNREQRLAISLNRRDATRQEVSDSFQSYDPLRDPEMRPSPFQAFVRIMIGCDKFCTYCVVPMTRGPEQSRPAKHILHEVRQLADEGVTLLGQTVNSYRNAEDGRMWRLSDLLAAMHDVPGLERIKFVTSFPRDMGDDLLQAVRDLPKVSRYLHVPAQSGCNDVLKRMKRGYTVEEYRDMMARIRATIPDCSVSSDFIVGFCGETEESFAKSMDLVRECRFKNSFIFKYSPRPGTKADELLPDDVPEEVKRRRNNEMLALQNEISDEQNVELIGRDFEVLVESLSKAAMKVDESFVPKEPGRAAPTNVSSDMSATTTTSGQHAPALGEDHEQDRDHDHHPQLMGRTKCDRIVVFDGNPRLIGSLTQVHIRSSRDNTSTAARGCCRYWLESAISKRSSNS